MRQAEANLAKDNAQLKNAEVLATRYDSLRKEGVTSREQSEQMQTNLDSLRQSVRADQAAIESSRAAVDTDLSAVERAKLDLTYCQIRSPISGRAGNLLVHAGNLVKVSDVALVVVNQIEPIFVSFGVPVTLLSFYGFRTERWALGGVAGAVATATRVTGIMMWPALAWIAWRSAKPTGRDRALAAGALVVASLGFVGYCAYIYDLTGQPLLWATALTRWGSGYHPGGAPWTAPVALVHRLLTHPYAFLASEPMALYDTLYGEPAAVCGGDSVRLAAVRRRVRPVHAAEPVRAALVGRVRGAGPLLLGPVSGVHLARLNPIALRLHLARRRVRAVLHAWPRAVRHSSPTLLVAGGDREP